MKKLLVGCGLVMAIGLVGVIVAGVATFTWWKQNAPDTGPYETIRAELREAYGEPETYHPPLDGSLDPDRVAAYLAVREDVVAVRDSIGEKISVFLEEVAGHDPGGESIFRGLGRGLTFAKRGIQVFADGVDYLFARAEAMREAGIGEGEYLYLDALVTHAWLGWDPIAVTESDPISGTERDVVEAAEEYVEHQRDLFLDQLRLTRRSLEDLAEPTAEQTAFLETVTAALERARESRYRFPFEEGMPERWAEVLEPFRTRIEATLPETAGEVLLEGADQLFDEEGGGFTFDVQSSS